jgi:hypothetical protein
MALPFFGPGGVVNLVQWNEPVSAANNPSGQPDVQNRVIEQIFTASGVDYTQVQNGFPGFSLGGHLHHVADIVDFPTNIGGGGSGGNSIGVIATKASLFASIGGGTNPLFMLCSEDSQIYYWNGTNWTIQVGKYSKVVDGSAFGAFGDGTVHTISTSDIANHNGIWKGTYVAGVDTWDFVSLQEAIYAAFAPTTQPLGTIQWNGGNVSLNSPLYLPPKNYVINRPLTINYTEGAYIFGGGEFATTITSTYQVAGFGSATVIQFNGWSYGNIENIQFQQSPNFPNPTGCLILQDWDGTNINGYNGAHQGNKWRNCYFNGNGQFPSTDPNFPNMMHVGYGIMVSPFVATSKQGSENYFYSCHWIWFEYGYFQDNFNSLQNGFIGGNFENCRLRGILAQEGAITVYNVGFQNDPSGPIGSTQRAGQQILYGGVDIAIINSANDSSLIQNCRSQSFNFVLSSNGHNTTVQGCNIVPFVNFWKPNTNYVPTDIVTGNPAPGQDGALWECTVGGSSAGSEPSWAGNTTRTDNTVTWVKMSNVGISGDNGTHVEKCIIPFSQMNDGTGSIHECLFTRTDWVPFGSSWPLTNLFDFGNNTVVVNFSGGGQSVWGIGNGSQHLNPYYFGPGSALLFRRPFGEIGFDYGDINFDIIGVYGIIGAKTPTGTDQPGQDTIAAGGMSTGAGIPGKFRIKVASPGASGTLPNNLGDVFVVDYTGVKLGPSASLITRNLQQDYTCTPGTIIATPGSNVFTQTNSFYGVLPGDIVEPSFTGQALPAGVLQQCTVIAPDKVRFDLYNGSNASQAITAGRVRYAVMVRPAVTGVTGQSAASDIAQLQVDLGTATAFQCMYDTRVQVTGSPSVTALNDIAGSGGGKGPTLNVFGTGNPQYILGGTLIQSNGTSFLAPSAASGAFDISGTKTILFGFSFPQNSSSQFVFSITNGIDSLQCYINNSGSGIGPYFPALNYNNPTPTGVSYPACPASGVLRFGYITLTTTTLTITIFDQGTVSQSITAFPAGSNILNIFPIVGGNTIMTLLSHFAILSAALTSDQISTYRSWGIAKHNNVTV